MELARVERRKDKRSPMGRGGKRMTEERLGRKEDKWLDDMDLMRDGEGKHEERSGNPPHHGAVVWYSVVGLPKERP